MAFSGSASSGLVTWWAVTPPSSYRRSSSPITAPLSARSRIRRMFTARAERFGSAWSLQVRPLTPNKISFQGNPNAYTFLKCCCPPVSPSYLQPRSPIFSCWRWLSEGASPPWCCSSSSLCPAGGARRRDKGREKDARRPPAKREKTLQCGKSERRGKGGGSVALFFSHSHFNSGDEGRCSSFSGPRGWFLSCWIHHFNFPPLHPLDLKSGPPDGHLPLSRAQLRIVESCRKM